MKYWFIDSPIPPLAKNTMDSRNEPNLLGLTTINKTSGINPIVSSFGTVSWEDGWLMLFLV